MAMLRKKPNTRTERYDSAGAFGGAQVPLGMLMPERLVGLGFRYWMSGYQTGDINCWEEAWRLFSNAIGPNPAKEAVSGLSTWVRCVNQCAARPIKVYPGRCRGFCRDECLAVSMIAASQHNTCPAMKACTFALVESVLTDDVIEQSECFAHTLRNFDQVLSPDSIVALPVAVLPPASGLKQ